MSIMPKVVQVRIRPVRFVGSSLKDLRAFPKDERHDIGVKLRLVEIGEKNIPSSKPWRGAGPGLYEIRESGERGTYRVVYWLRFGAAVYVLHCFQKKAKYKSETPLADVELVRRRLREAKLDYDKNYASAKK